MVSNLNVIMKYNRTKPVWVCPDCDTENDLNSETCFTCDKPKTPMARVITPESERRDMEESITIRHDTYAPYPSVPTSPISPPTTSAPMYHTELSRPATEFSSGGSKAGLIIAIIIVILAICAAAGVYVVYAEESPEESRDYYITDMEYSELSQENITDSI